MGAHDTAALLGRLLAERPMYRRQWERYSRSAVDRQSVHQPAVCAVIVEWLMDAGEMEERTANPTRRIRDRVRRALAGDVLTAETLRWFTEAFQLNADDRTRLQALLGGAGNTRVFSGRYNAEQIPPAHPRGHRTMSLNEHHYLDADGLPVRHRTTQVIEATVDGLATHRYMFDSAALSVQVQQGGRLTAGDVRQVTDGIYGIDIELTRPLNRGETTNLVYDTMFAYPEAPPPEFRRAASIPVENVDLRVQFDPGRLPSAVFFATWADLDSPPVDVEQVPLEPDNSVHRYISQMERTIIGFHWQW